MKDIEKIIELTSIDLEQRIEILLKIQKILKSKNIIIENNGYLISKDGIFLDDLKISFDTLWLVDINFKSLEIVTSNI